MKAKDLKNSILQMAIEGKLVPQDPSDEPASVLLERIREEKHKLIAEGKAKFPKGGESIIYIGSDGSPYEKRVDAKGRVLSDKCIADEVPFERLPEGWAWTRLGSALSNRDAERVPVSVADREKLDKIYDYYGASGVIDKVDSYLFDKPLLLVGEDGANLLTRSKPIAFMARGKYWVNNHAHVLDGISEGYLEYIALYINSISLAPYVTGTAQPKMNQTKMGLILIPIPPLAEQRRIVERVGELMPLVEEYGGLEDAREALDAALPGRLRKSVLQLAVQGGLVPQDPADEPAGVLLERVRGQRRQLVAEGKMRAPKGGESIIFAGSDGRRYEKRIDARGRESEPVCIDDEIPFEIPAGWEWARLGSVFTKMGSGSTPAGGRKVYRDEGPMLIRSQNVHNEGLRLDDVAHFAYSLFAKRGSHVLPNDMLLNITGASIGRCAIVPNTFGDADVNQHVLIMRPVSTTFSEYLHAAIISPLVQSAIMAGQVGATKEGLSATKAAHLLIPLPPLAEQRRIVDVVDRLFKILA